MIHNLQNEDENEDAENLEEENKNENGEIENENLKTMMTLNKEIT